MIYDSYNLPVNLFCEQCGIVGCNYIFSEGSICTLEGLICSKCGLGIDLYNNTNMTLLEGYDIVDIQLMMLGIEDNQRLQKQIKNSSMNLKRRRDIKEYKKQKLYNKIKNKFTFGGVYYKQNTETGDYFLSEFSYGTKKHYQKEANNKTRNSVNFGLKGSNYKKLYDIEWKII